MGFPRDGDIGPQDEGGKTDQEIQPQPEDDEGPAARVGENTGQRRRPPAERDRIAGLWILADNYGSKMNRIAAPVSAETPPDAPSRMAN